jgi:hypothetical protein
VTRIERQDGGDARDKVRLAGRLTFPAGRLLRIDLAVHFLAAEHPGRAHADVLARAMAYRLGVGYRMAGSERA